jgi:lysophospholipase L1-like esterase
MMRLPVDTWTMASIPAGVRLEFDGEVDRVELAYTCAHESFGYLGGGEGHSFVALRAGEVTDRRPAEVGEHRVRLSVPGSGPAVIHLPERMGPTVAEIAGVGADITPAPAGPRWLCYGDSIAEGWCVTSPELAWPAVAARAHGLDVVNLGYAGSSRGEIPSAEELAELDADVISIAHGTNCWTRTPHSTELFAVNLGVFLDIVRQGHPDTPVVAISPITRPDAESTENRLGMTLADLRAAFETVVQGRIDDGDRALSLVEGLPIVAPDQLTDDIHPGDEGHAAMAAVIGPAIAAAGAR